MHPQTRRAHNGSWNKCKMEGKNGSERIEEWVEIYYRQHTAKSHKALFHTHSPLYIFVCYLRSCNTLAFWNQLMGKGGNSEFSCHVTLWHKFEFYLLLPSLYCLTTSHPPSSSADDKVAYALLPAQPTNWKL